MAKSWRLPKGEAPIEGQQRLVTVDGRSIAVFHRGGKLYALDAKCTHVGGPLDQGRVEGSAVVCPWHGSRFDLSTGAVVQGPARSPVRAYRARIDDDSLVLEGE